MRYFMGMGWSDRAGDGAVGILKSPFRGLLAFLALCSGVVSGRAQSNPAPILNIGWRSNQLQLSIVNAATGRVYQIQQRSNLGSSTSWTPQLLSSPGQTN